MCFETTKWAIESDVSAGEKLTLIVLAYFTNHTTRICNPKHESIAKMAGLGLSTVKAHLSTLSKSGYIKIKQNFLNGNQLNNSYTFPLYTGPKSGTLNLKSGPLGGQISATVNKEELNKEIHIHESSDSDGDEVNEDEKALAIKDQIPYADIVAAYHHFLPNLPRKLKISPKLKTAIKSRWKEDKRHQNLEFWSNYFDNVNLFDFYAKPKPDAWVCTFDHLVTSSKFNAMIEKIQHHYSRSQ